MGTCARCGKNTGFLGGSYCKDEEDWNYGDTLEVVSGFYEKQVGELIAEYDCGWKSTADYKIRTRDGNIIDELDEKQVRRIKKVGE